jgi:hypothetical protein
VNSTRLVLVGRLDRLARFLTVQESILQDLKRKKSRQRFPSLVSFQASSAGRSDPQSNPTSKRHQHCRRFAEPKKRFVPNIEAKKTKRDEALNELRFAILFDHTGFPVVQLDPPGANKKVGEYLIDSPEKANVFVELKSVVNPPRRGGLV